MSSTLADLSRVVYMMGDVLVHGSSVEKSDQQLTTELDTLQKARVTLNKEKCQFSKRSVQLVSQVTRSSQ